MILRTIKVKNTLTQKQQFIRGTIQYGLVNIP
jgi:hypothetical protein